MISKKLVEQKKELVNFKKIEHELLLRIEVFT